MNPDGFICEIYVDEYKKERPIEKVEVKETKDKKSKEIIETHVIGRLKIKTAQMRDFLTFNWNLHLEAGKVNWINIINIKEFTIGHARMMNKKILSEVGRIGIPRYVEFHLD